MCAKIATADKSLTKTVKSELEKISTVSFDAERFRAPFTLRCAAVLIDYLILIVAPVVSLMLSRSAGMSGAKIFNNQSYYTAWTISAFLLVANLLILPILTGRTLGKAAMGLRVVQNSGDRVTLAAAVLRYLIGYPLTILTGGLGFLLAIFNREGRALHDLVAGTVVVQATPHQLKAKK